ncbi:hypothetical protein [Streptomyces sp. NPDC060001]|uniref:hypothetical protein n=1 Tax=Streptomyces sp. NPDC060001 TaxID=3347032 RepID=UPI00367BB99D
MTTQQGNAIKRLEARVQRQEEDSERQRKRIGDQDATIGYLLNRVRGLAAFIRASKLEPPPAEPMPDRVRAYIQHIDV